MTYGSRTGIDDIYGKSNVTAWADLDGTKLEEVIDARVDRALERADNEINDRLRGGPYAIPWASPIPEGVSYLANLYAGYWLYGNRGSVDTDGEGRVVDRYTSKRKEFDTSIRNILAGRLRPGGQPVSKTYPEIVPNDDT